MPESGIPIGSYRSSLMLRERTPLRFLISLSEVIRAVPVAMAGLAGRPRRLTGISYHTRLPVQGSNSPWPILSLFLRRSNTKEDWLNWSPGLYVIFTWSGSSSGNALRARMPAWSAGIVPEAVADRDTFAAGNDEDRSDDCGVT